MTKNTGINFAKFERIRGQIEMRNFRIAQTNSDARNDLYKKYIVEQMVANPAEVVTFNDLIKENLVASTMIARDVTDLERKKVIELRISRGISNDLYSHFMDSDKCLVMLSEAPTQHIINWATRTYQVDTGPVKKMIQNGYHDDKVWESIFFQLLLSMLIMFEKKIMFSEFSLKNNVYIKDLRHNDQNVGIWKYIHNGVEYYVPNYGYLLLIDSNYAEISANPDPLSRNYDPSKIMFRIKSPLLNDSNLNGEIYKLCLDRMISVFDPNNFGREFTNYGGIAPTQIFLNKLSIIQSALLAIKGTHFGVPKIWTDLDHNQIMEDMKSLPITLHILNAFDMVHSRIGMPVKDQEKSYISDRFDLGTKNGSTIIRKITDTFSTFAVYLGTNPASGRLNILTTNEPIFGHEDRQNKRLISIEVDRGQLFNYFGTPEHSYEPGKQYNILETYMMSLGN